MPPADPRFVIHVVCNEAALTAPDTHTTTEPADSTESRVESSAETSDPAAGKESVGSTAEPADNTESRVESSVKTSDPAAGTAGSMPGTGDGVGIAADSVDDTDAGSGDKSDAGTDGDDGPGTRTVRVERPRPDVSPEAAPVGFMDGYGIISAEHVRDIAARPDAVIHRVVPINTPENADGTFTLPAHGVDPYRPSTALDEAVRCRDGYCVDPGCAHSAWTADNDHVAEYDHHNPDAGGPTSYENLNTKCRYGHIQKTFGNWVDDQYRDPATGRLVTEYVTPEGFVIPGDAETFEDTFPGLRRLRFTPPTTGDPPPRTPRPPSPQTPPRHRTRAANKHARRRAERHRNRQRRLTREAQRLLFVDDVGLPRSEGVLRCRGAVHRAAIRTRVSP